MTAVAVMTGVASGENIPVVDLLRTSDLALGLAPGPNQDRAEAARRPTLAPPICAHVYARVRVRLIVCITTITITTTMRGTRTIVCGNRSRHLVASLLALPLGLLAPVIVGAARQITVGGDRAVPPRLCSSLHLHRLASPANLSLTAENLENLRLRDLWHLASKCRAFVVVVVEEVGPVVVAGVPCLEGWRPGLYLVMHLGIRPGMCLEVCI